MKRWAILLLCLCAAACVSGCATMGVRAWERDVLAKPEMELDHEAADLAMDDHIYFSREASAGGRAFGGGGCGCN